VVKRVYRHILREALHKPENYGKWTINIEIKEGEKRKKRGKMEGRGERGEGNREMGEKIQKKKTRNKSKTKPLKIKPKVFQKAL